MIAPGGMGLVFGRISGWLWRLVWGPTLRYTRERLQIEMSAFLLSRGLTAAPPKHLWFENGQYVVRDGCAPPDSERPYRLRGLDLNLCVGRLQGQVTHRGSPSWIRKPSSTKPYNR